MHSEGDDTVLSNFGAFLWFAYSQEYCYEFAKVASRFKGGEEAKLFLENKLDNIRIRYYEGDVLWAAEKGYEHAIYEILNDEHYNLPFNFYNNLQNQGWIKNLDETSYEYTYKYYNFEEGNCYISYNKHKKRFLSFLLHYTYYSVEKEKIIIFNFEFDINYNIKNEVKYYFGKFAYEIRDLLTEDFDPFIQFYLDAKKRSMDAINTWSIVGKRLGVVKDMRIYIGKMLLKDKLEWINPPAPKKKFWIQIMFNLCFITVLFLYFLK